MFSYVFNISDWPRVAVGALKPTGPHKPQESPTDGHKTLSGFFPVCILSVHLNWMLRQYRCSWTAAALTLCEKILCLYTEIRHIDTSAWVFDVWGNISALCVLSLHREDHVCADAGHAKPKQPEVSAWADSSRRGDYEFCWPSWRVLLAFSQVEDLFSKCLFISKCCLLI